MQFWKIETIAHGYVDRAHIGPLLLNYNIETQPIFAMNEQ
jgi:hypothetical protein